MKVKLISYSKPTEELCNEGLEDLQDLVASQPYCVLEKTAIFSDCLTCTQNPTW